MGLLLSLIDSSPILFVIVAGVGAGAYALSVRDLIRRGRLHRRNEQLIAQGAAPLLSEGRVPCPECAEAILPQARRCPYCRSAVSVSV